MKKQFLIFIFSSLLLVSLAFLVPGNYTLNQNTKEKLSNVFLPEDNIAFANEGIYIDCAPVDWELCDRFIHVRMVYIG